MEELCLCLVKLGANAPASPSGRRSAPPTKPSSPFDTTEQRKRPAPAPRPPGLAKAAGVPSELERIYETIGPSAGARKALEYVTPRMDAHQVGRAAGKLLARNKTSFGELAATGRKSADTARGALGRAAAAHAKTASGFHHALVELSAAILP